MKITDVKPLVMGLSWRNLIFIKVETDEGITSIGGAVIEDREEVSRGAERTALLWGGPGVTCSRVWAG